MYVKILKHPECCRFRNNYSSNDDDSQNSDKLKYVNKI